MKKRFASLVLTVSMCLTLCTVTAKAEGPFSVEEGVKNISITYDIGDGDIENTDVEKEMTISEIVDPDTDEMGTFSIRGYVAVRKNTVITIQNTGTVDDGSYIVVDMIPYSRSGGSGAYEWPDFHRLYLTNNEGFVRDELDPEPFGGQVMLHAGQSKQFVLPFQWAEDGEEMLFMVQFTMYYPQYDYSYWKYVYFLEDTATVNAALSKEPIDQYVGAIPEVADMVVFSDNALASHTTTALVMEKDKKGNYDWVEKEIVYYDFPVGTTIRLTDKALKQDYLGMNLDNLDTDGTQLTIKQASTQYDEYLFSTYDDSEEFILYIRGVNPSPSFTDVKDSDYFIEPVKWAVRYGITAGTTDTTFSPNSTCTTAQIITFLWRAKGAMPFYEDEFNYADVKTSDYYFQAAGWAKLFGLISGNQFNGDTPCTRAAVMTYLWKLAGSPATKVNTTLTDVPADAPYAQAVAWAVERGITAGTSATTFSPDAICTRAQIMTFLYKDLGQ